ncbi:MAG: ABC transporter ATP-binding protein [Planctomycetes bacterium]|nr:ABC transporter ATP-binding protein [Planctomycetota bacterium]
MRSSKTEFRDYLRRHRAARATGTTSTDQDAPARDPARRRRYLRAYRRYLRPYLGRLAVVFLLALISAALSLVTPLVTRYIIDTVLTLPGTPAAEKLRRLLVVCSLNLILLLLSQGVDTVRTHMMSVLNSQVIARLRQKLLERFLRLPLSDLYEFKSGGIVSRLSQDVDKVTGMVQTAVITPGVAGMRVVLTLSLLVFLSWRLALVAGMLIPPIVAINFIWIRKVKPIYRAMADARAEIDARITETFGGIRVVRAFRRERKEERDYAVANHTNIRRNLLAERLQLVVTSAWGLVVPATTLAIVGFGGYLVIHGRATVGDIVAFQMYALMLLGPVSAIVSSFSGTQQAVAALERVFDVLERAEDKPDAPGALETPRPIRELRFDHVSFEYRPGLPVLREVDLTVPAGSTIALVGPSGGGKTTLTDLVARFHDPTAGAVLVNGIDLRKLRLASYRQRLAVVPQEVFLFDGTVADNIAYGRRSASRDAIASAARKANAHEFIQRLPEGYDTVIGERGVKLSGGQRQRLSIARAILADPEILIMDEATSNLDTESEQLIQASLANLLGTRTTFVIAHRLSTITHADIIVVLNHGRVEQMGTHVQLMSVDGLYRRMVERQQQLSAFAGPSEGWL